MMALKKPTICLAQELPVPEETLTEVRKSVLETLDLNKDGRIELGEFAK